MARSSRARPSSDKRLPGRRSRHPTPLGTRGEHTGGGLEQQIAAQPDPDRFAMLACQRPLPVIDRRNGVQVVKAAFPEKAADEKTALQCLGVLGEVGHRVASAGQGLLEIPGNGLHMAPRMTGPPFRPSIAVRALSAAARAVLAACSASVAISATRRYNASSLTNLPTVPRPARMPSTMRARVFRYAPAGPADRLDDAEPRFSRARWHWLPSR